MSKSSIKAIFLYVFFVLLTACGGGGAEETIEQPEPIVEAPAVDNTPPSLSLNGDSNMQIEAGDSYIELGAVATDDVDENVEVIITGDLDLSVLGEYEIQYQATDSSGNSSILTRTITVVDTLPPQITLVGDDFIIIYQNDTFSDPSVDIIDNTTTTLSVDGIVDSSIVGTYTLTYTATDMAGNEASVQRFVTVEVPPFIGTWKTDNFGASSDTQLMLDIHTNDANFSIDWGDGTIVQGVDVSTTHNYATPGVYTVKINGNFTIYHNDGSVNDSNKMLSIERWGNSVWTTMNSAFNGCENLVLNATDKPNLSNVTDMHSMFNGATLVNGDLSDWDVSNVENMWAMFANAKSFNSDLSNWDVANVTNFGLMFEGASEFNQDLSRWDVSSAIFLNGMFAQASQFQSDLSSWNVANVIDMNSMFSGARAFSADLSQWNVAKVTNMRTMFSYAESFESDLSNWDVSAVEDMMYMFHVAKRFDSDISNWDVSSVTNMAHMFQSAESFNSDISQWNVSNVTNMAEMFTSAVLFDSDLSDWDVSNVITMYGMFINAKLFNSDLSKWDVANVTNFRFMFSGASEFNQDLSRWEVSRVTDMYGMFENANVFNQDLSQWDVSSVTDMGYMFFGTNNFDADISAWNITSVTNMAGMFDGSSKSTTFYDTLLNGWASQNVQFEVTFSAGNTQYSSAGEAARETLVNDFGWTISDNGKAP